MLYKKIKIGEVEYTMSAAASVNVVYQNVFGEDFLSTIDMEHPESAMMPFQKMAFIMAMVGEHGRKVANTKTVEDYEDWLDQFTFADLMNAITDIEELYMNAQATTVDSKKN